MTQRGLTTVIDGYSFLEAPRWHDGRLWCSDFYTHSVIAVSPGGQVEHMATVPAQPSGLGWLPDGRLLVSSMGDHRVLRQEADGTLVTHADLSAVAGGVLNDMVVDAAGRAYVGNFGFDLMGTAPFRPANLARVDPDGAVTVVAEDLLFPNGSMLTPDGATLIVNETFGNRISAFAVAADGSLGPRRDWAVFGDRPDTDDVNALIAASVVAPDGGCLDTEGAVWAADATGHRVVRVAEGGTILEEISTGDDGVYACMLGGDDGRTLHLCVAPNFDAAERSATRLGRLLATTVNVPGV